MVDVLGHNKKKKNLFFVVLFFFFFFNNNIVKADSKMAKSIKINKDSISMKIDDEIKLSYLLTPMDAKDKVRWGSSDNSIVRVDESGKVRAVKVGEADVVAYLKNKVSIRDKCHVVVTDRSDIKEIKFNKKTVTIEKGMTGRINIKILPDDASEKDLLWTSSNDKVVKISKTGRVRAIDVGTVVVTAVSSKNSEIKDSCEVIVKDKKVLLRKIKLNVNSKALYYGESYKLKVRFRPNDATDKDINYVSSDPSLVTVSNKGEIKVIKNQNRKVTVRAYAKNNKKINDKIVISTKVKLKKLSVVKKSEELLLIDPKKDKDYNGIYRPRGFCVVNYENDIYLYTAMVNNKRTKTTIRIYKKNSRDDGKVDFKLVNSFTKNKSYLGYAMDMTYDPDKGIIYITGSNKKGIHSFKVKDSFKGVPKFEKSYFYKDGNKKKYSNGGIAYDKVKKKYYYSGNSTIYKSDDKFNLGYKYLKADGKYIRRKGIGISSSVGGISAYDGKLFVIRYNSNVTDTKSTIGKPRNAVDVYDASNGEYIGTNIIKLDNDRYEVKAIDHYEGDYYLIYCYEKGKYKSYIKKIKLKLS